MRQTDRLIINVLSNYGLTVVGGIASLIVVPIVVNDLTQTGYGLAMMLLSGITITTTLGNAVNRAMQRYLPQDLESADTERVNGTFNSAMAMYGMLGLFAAITMLLLRNWYLDDPGITAELKADGNMAFFCVAIFMLIEGPLLTFQAGLEAIQRFDLVGAYTGATTVLRMLAIIVFFKLGAGSIVIFALSHMLAMILASAFFFRLFEAGHSKARILNTLYSRRSIQGSFCLCRRRFDDDAWKRSRPGRISSTCREGPEHGRCGRPFRGMGVSLDGIHGYLQHD